MVLHGLWCGYLTFYLYTWSLTNPHRKKSGGVRSGNLAGLAIYDDPLYAWNVYMCGQEISCEPVAPVVPLTLPEVVGSDTEPTLLGASGSGLDSSKYVARYSWDIEEVETLVWYRPAETGLNRGPHQQTGSWQTLS